jgi:hypothetical protein
MTVVSGPHQRRISLGLKRSAISKNKEKKAMGRKILGLVLATVVL